MTAALIIILAGIVALVASAHLPALSGLLAVVGVAFLFFGAVVAVSQINPKKPDTNNGGR